MIEVLVTAAAVGVGFVVAKLRRPPRRKRTTMVALRQATRRGGVAYRDAGGEIAVPLAELVAAASSVGPIAQEPHRLIVKRGDEALEITVPEPARVTLASLDIVDGEGETLAFELALAWVPLYGPVTLTEAAWGSFLVDGTRPVAALVEERADRMRAIAKAIADDMAEKLKVYGGPS